MKVLRFLSNIIGKILSNLFYQIFFALLISQITASQVKTQYQQVVDKLIKRISATLPLYHISEILENYLILSFFLFLIFFIIIRIIWEIIKNKNNHIHYENRGKVFWKYDILNCIFYFEPYCPRHRLKLHRDYSFYPGVKYYCQEKNHRIWVFSEHKLDQIRKEVENILEKKFDYNPNSEFEN